MVVTVSPGGDFVVAGASPEAAVQVANETVAEGAERLVGGRLRHAADRRTRGSPGWPAASTAPTVDCVVEPPVADEPGFHGVLAAGCYGDVARHSLALRNGFDDDPPASSLGLDEHVVASEHQLAHRWAD